MQTITRLNKKSKTLKMCSSRRRPVCSHSPVCIEKLFNTCMNRTSLQYRALIYFSVILIWSYMRLYLGNCTIRYISDSQHLNMICIITYSDLITFFWYYFQYNIYVNIYISLHRTTVRSHFISFTDLQYTCLSKD